MRTSARFFGIAAVTAGLMAFGAPAFAGSNNVTPPKQDNDGINALNDNNLSVLPIQLCGNDIAVVGAIIPIKSPEQTKCVNAPIMEGAGG